MAIEAHVQEQILAGLDFALNQVQPGAVLVGEWSLEQKSSFEICGWRGACWTHGVDASSWPEMAAEAANEGGRSMYDYATECYAEKGEIYFGSGRARQGSEVLQLRTHVTHSLSSGTHTYVCVVWVKGREGMTVAKCAAGFSGCYDPSEFHTLGLAEKEKDLPPPYEIDFKE